MFIEIKSLLIALALLAPRAYVCLSILPGFGTRTLVGVARNAVSMAIVLPAIIPTYLAVQQAPPDLIVGAALAFKEAAIGALFGTLLAMPIWVVQSVGSALDLQRTPIQTPNLNASLDQDASALSGLLLQAAVLVMVDAGLYLAMTKILLESFEVWPALTLAPPFELAQLEVMIGRAGKFMGYIVIYATPVIIPLLLVDLTFAVVGVFAPSMQVSPAASPIKSLVGLLVLLLYWPTFAHYIGDDFSHQLDLIRSLYRPRGN